MTLTTPPAATGDDNEVYLKRALRVFRNAIVGHLRDGLTAAFGEDTEAKLSGLFGKKEPETEVTQWQRMKINAERARASPEVSSAVVDHFELLGVSDFFTIFEKFFVEIGPPAASATEDAAVTADRKKGFLRCLQQVKVFRDPNAHDVSQAIGIDSLMLCILNGKLVCRQLGMASAYDGLNDLHREASQAFAGKHAILVRVSDEPESFELGRKCLSLAGASFDIGRPVDLLASGKFASSLGDAQNWVLVVGGLATSTLSDPEVDALNEALTAFERQGISPMMLISHRLDDKQIEAVLTPESLRAFLRADRLPMHGAYAETVGSNLNRLLKSGAPRRRSSAAVSVTAAQAVHDDKLAPMIFSLMRDPQLKAARIVAPFATDLRMEALGPISQAMIEAKNRGCKVCLITRPPSVNDADVLAKRQLLRLLHSEQIELYVNPLLHAKVYLFEREAERNFWAVGSHNLTNFAHDGASIETSMFGYRSQEFEEAQTSFERARRHAKTLNYDVWTNQQMQAASLPP